MKFSNVLPVFIIISILSIFSILSIDTSTSQEDDYSISIVEKNYDFIKREEIKGHTFEYYNIRIVLNNSGNIISDDITVEMGGEDGLTEKLNYTIPAKFSQEFVFSNFFIEEADQHRINISYYPTSLSVHERNEDNSGFTTLDFSKTTISDESTPGFEMVFLIFAFILYLFKRKKKLIL